MKKWTGKRIAFWMSILLTVIVLAGGSVTTILSKKASDTFYTVFVGAGWQESWDETDGQVFENLRYDDNDGRNTNRNKYDLYIPKGLDKTKEQGVVLFIHGGSWQFGNKDSMDWAARRYAKKGYITATMSYNLISGKYPALALLTGSPSDVTIYDMLDDVNHAIEAIKLELEELGYKPSKLALSGMSSGSHLALLYAYSRQEDSAIPVSFVFEQTGPVDMHKVAWNPQNKKDGAQEDGIAAYMTMFTGQVVSEQDILTQNKEELIDSISPIHFIDEQTVPTLMGYAGKDTVIGIGHYPLLKQTLDENQVVNETVMYPNSDHMLESDPESDKLWETKVTEWLDRYLSE